MHSSCSISFSFSWADTWPPGLAHRKNPGRWCLLKNRIGSILQFLNETVCPAGIYSLPRTPTRSYSFLGKGCPDDVPCQIFHPRFVMRPDGRTTINVESTVMPTHHVFDDGIGDLSFFFSAFRTLHFEKHPLGLRRKAED